MGSLHSIQQHGLEMISFLATYGNKFPSQPFFCFLNLLIDIFIASLLSIHLPRLEMISFFCST